MSCQLPLPDIISNSPFPCSSRMEVYMNITSLMQGAKVRVFMYPSRI